MIEVLLVEDADRKLEKILAAVERIVGTAPIRIDTARSVYEGLRRLEERKYSLLVLDLLLPRRPGEEPIHGGGTEILRALARDRRFYSPDVVIGLTAYANLAAEQASVFKHHLWHVVEYRDESAEWEQSLAVALERVAAQREAPVGGYSSDIAIVTALHPVELESVLALEGQWTRHPVAGDDTAYFEGTWRRSDGDLRIVAAAAPEMGMPAAAALSMKMIEVFRPHVIAMTGLAAGVRGNYGDILVAEQSWDYGSGKIKTGPKGRSVFLPAPSAIPLAFALKARIQAFTLRSEVLAQIRARWKGADDMPVTLDVQLGPLASGAAVLEDPALVREIVSHNRKLIGVEMETYGVFTAAASCRAPRPLALSVKSICDFADSGKSDKYQKYAAFTSANYLYELAVGGLSDLFTERRQAVPTADAQGFNRD